MDVPCWVSDLALTCDLHYDQRSNACWWMTGDSGQTGCVGVEEEMQEGPQMESGVKGKGEKCKGREMDKVDETKGEDEMKE